MANWTPLIQFVTDISSTLYFAKGIRVNLMDVGMQLFVYINVELYLIPAESTQ